MPSSGRPGASGHSARYVPHFAPTVALPHQRKGDLVLRGFTLD
jgi:hypothetical protein